jgi:membrane protease YdiL (CAAX protease family)
MGRDATTQRSDLYLFVVLSCILSWSLWGLIIASARGWISVSIPLNPWGSFGPAVAAVLVVLRSRGWNGVRSLLAPLLWWRWGLTWWIVVLAGPLALVGVAVVVLPLIGTELSAAPSIPWGQMALLLPVILVVGGPLGEEIGWRGYALPELLTKQGPIAASVIVAGIWMLWHLPLFWVPGATQEGSSIIVFLALVLALSILTTWIYLETNRSLLAAVMFHFSINVSTYYVPLIWPSVDGLVLFDEVLVVVVWLAAFAAMIRLWRHRYVEERE